MTLQDPVTYVSPALRQTLLAEARRQLLDVMAEAVRTMGFMTADVIEATVSATGEGFDELAKLRDKRSFQMAKSMTASRISLVHEEDLEFTIRLSDLARRLRSLTDQELSPLHVRFVRLLQQQEVSDEQTPVGPDTVCAGLRALVDAADLMPEMRLTLLLRAEAPLGAALKKLYKRLNDHFEEAGLLSSLTRNRNQNTAPRVVVPGGALQQLQQRLASGTTNIPGSTGEGSIDPALGAALREKIMSWLIEQQEARAGRPAPGPLLGLGGTGIAALLSPTGRASLEALGRLFEALFADTELPDQIKGLVGRLQIPILRLALADEDVITRADHPARRLVDRIGSAMIGKKLQPESLQTLHSILDKLEKCPAPDTAAFAEAVAAVDVYIESARAQLIEQVAEFIEAAQHEEQREAAVRMAAQALRAICGPDLPTQVNNFLQTYWIKVLIGAWLSRGEDSDIWRKLLETANQLVQSGKLVEHAEQREALTRTLPELAKRLDSGLALASMDEAGRTAALQPCLAMHAALMGGYPIPTVPATPPRPPLRWRGVPHVPGLRVARCPEFIEYEPVSSPLLDTIEVGTPLTCVLPDLSKSGNPRNGTVAWIGPERRVLLWVTPAMKGCCLLPSRWLAEALGSGEVKLPFSEPLFERLATAALRR